MATFMRHRGPVNRLELVLAGTELVESDALGWIARRQLHDERAAQIAYGLRIGEILDAGWWRSSRFADDLLPEAPLPFTADDDGALTVLRDALLERGDPRGELAALRAADAGDARAISSLEKTRGLELFGMFAFLPRPWRAQIGFGWRAGWIDEIVATSEGPAASLHEILHAALHVPMARFARTLTLDAAYEAATARIVPCACLAGRAVRAPR